LVVEARTMVDVDTRVKLMVAPGRGRGSRRVLTLAATVLMFALMAPATAQEAWTTSPFHGVPNAATGKNIPCVCRYKGAALPLGTEICLNTPYGMMLARCDLQLNNTTWAPTTTPCQINS
jgi:hypothetical protein